MDDESFKQRKERITLVIAIIAIALSLVSFGRDFFWKSSKLRFTFLEISELQGQKNGVLAINLSIANIGNRPAVVSDINFFISVPPETQMQNPSVQQDPTEYVDMSSYFAHSPQLDFFEAPFVLKPGEMVVKTIPAR